MHQFLAKNKNTMSIITNFRKSLACTKKLTYYEQNLGNVWSYFLRKWGLYHCPIYGSVELFVCHHPTSFPNKVWTRYLLSAWCVRNLKDMREGKSAVKKPPLTVRYSESFSFPSCEWHGRVRETKGNMYAGQVSIKLGPTSKVSFGVTGKTRGRRLGGNHGQYVCPGTKKEHTHVLWESRKILVKQSTRASRKPGGIWIAGTVSGKKGRLQAFLGGMQEIVHRSF